MNPYIINIYLKLKFPDETKNSIQKFISFFESHGFTEKKLKENAENFEKMMVEYYKSFIDESAPFTAEEIRQLHKEKTAKRIGGEKIPDHSMPMLVTALKAFLKVDQAKGTTAEAINEALSDIANEFGKYPQKSVRKWLQEILPLSDIQQSPRGRPKNKT